MFQKMKVHKQAVAALALMALVGGLWAPLKAFAAETDAPAPPNGGYDVGRLPDAEAEGLLYMREEEKLAHDVYLTLYEQWGLQLFQNIATSEAVHTETIRALLERYGLEDPAAENALGVFANADLQALYDQLVAQGSSSLEEALRVGAAIEEIDILDLQARLETTTTAELRQVYATLMAGSGNHLRAFANTLETQSGVVYQPQYLDAETYQAIVEGRTSGLGTTQGQAFGQAQGQGAFGQGAGGQGMLGQGAFSQGAAAQEPHGQGFGHGRGRGRGGQMGSAWAQH